MKTKLHSLLLVPALIAGVHRVPAQNPVITSFSENGVLVCSNLAPGSTASIEWASAIPNGPWSNWPGMEAVLVDSNGMIQVNVPMWYRVRGVGQVTNSITTSDGMALIAAGSFTIGDVNDANAEGDAAPTNVYVSAFYMDTNLVSYSQWQTVYNWAATHGFGFDHPGSGKAANHPVQLVNWYDCVKWCNARSQQAGKTPAYYTDAGLTRVYTNGDTDAVYVNWAVSGYRLPTEAEWEKAARGGLSGQRYPWGNTISESQANYWGNTYDYSYDLGPNGYNANFDTGGYPYTSPVGTFAANGYGLNDMAGNVWEWCWDWYDYNLSSAGSPYAGGTDSRGPASSPYASRVLRGGSWDDFANFARCAFRVLNDDPTDAYNDFGFRCVRGF